MPSPTEILLEWEEPFTSQGYPILSYIVIETETATGESRTFTRHALNHTHAISNIATQCRKIRFEVMATNEVGDSDSTIVTAGFPIGNETE